ncbi:MAG: EthD domain-containing protein [Pacificimonas sp.]|jgi:uncharacterized protein (TIGR02118 family)|nr:EthD domain-containing protein [Pacificimonas sp.]
MLKITYCLTRRPEMSRSEFQAYWRETHAPLVAAARGPLNIARYVQMHTGAVPDGVASGRPGMPDDEYDGVAELWWRSLEDLQAADATEEGQRHGMILAEDEAQFIDFSRSRLFWGVDKTIFD